MTSLRGFLMLALLCWASVGGAVPPLVIGDVPTADRGTVETYAGVQQVKNGAVEWAVPTTETVLGISNWQEITIEVPYLVADAGHGLGDLVLGTKVQLLPEASGRPGLAGSVEWKLANGDLASGTGSGSMEFGLLLRAQQTWGRTTLIGNAGYTFVGTPKVAGVAVPVRNTGFLGLGAEVEIHGGVALVADFYWRSPDAPGAPARLAGDLGFKWHMAEHLALLGAVGTSLRPDSLGGPQLRTYVGVKGEFTVF
jgi:Putative MetA-pathway of phenol degradation